MERNLTYEVKMENGTYLFHLFKVLKDRGVTQSRFLRDMESNYTTIVRYAKGTIQKIDLEMIDRWCKYLNCTFTDLIEYVRK